MLKAAASDVVPAGQDGQLVWELNGWYVPAAHSWQLALRTE